MTTGERERLISHLEMTGSWLADELAGLSQAQLEYRKTPDSWSVREVVEHLAIAEPQYWKNLQDLIAGPPANEPTTAKDAGVLWYGIDRTEHTKTGKAREPSGQFVNQTSKALESFTKLRATMLDFARTTDADLRSRNFGKNAVDGYQWFVMISSHAQRHILQIRELKHSKDFPVK